MLNVIDVKYGEIDVRTMEEGAKEEFISLRFLPSREC